MKHYDKKESQDKKKKEILQTLWILNCKKNKKKIEKI